ncbi:MAG: flagellar basal-body MS-ring/collar protein FliF [Rhodothalassiaceae bacterium]
MIELLKSFGAARLIGMGAVAAGLIGFFLFISMRLSEPQMALLFADLEMAESSRIVETLNARNIPFRLLDGGRTIMAPEDRINELRVTLAGEGLGGAIVGYEIFDRSDGLGTTSFVQNINRLRAIEGELARTIREIRAVESARVHIVLPERQLFSRDRAEATASIILRTRGTLSQQQVLAIQSLVAAAVPDLAPQSVSIVDQNGTLLARGGEAGSADGPIGNFEEKRQRLEDSLRSRIETLLEKTVGHGKVRAQVAVELDMSAETTNEERFDPDSQVARSTRTLEEGSVDREKGPQAVTVANNLPDAGTGTEGNATSESTKTDETVNFEISRTVRTLVRERGDIARLSAAVVVDGIWETDANGVRQYRERSPEQLEQLAALVRSAIGYDENRGDVVEVANLPFVDDAFATEDLEKPFELLGLGKRDLYQLVEMLMLGVVSLLVLLLVVRPLVNRLVAAIPEAGAQGQLAGGGGYPALAAPEITPEIEEAAALGDERALQTIARAREAQQALPTPAPGSNISVGAVGDRLKESAVKKIGDIVRGHPDEATAIVRSWLYAE